MTGYERSRLMDTIRIDMTEEQLQAVLNVVGQFVSRHRAPEGTPIYEAERALDSALLGYEEGESESCDCDGGVLIMAHDGDTSREWIERCDDCEVFESDEAAAVAMSERGYPVGWARIHGHLQPYLIES